MLRPKLTTPLSSLLCLVLLTGSIQDLMGQESSAKKELIHTLSVKFEELIKFCAAPKSGNIEYIFTSDAKIVDCISPDITWTRRGNLQPITPQQYVDRLQRNFVNINGDLFSFPFAHFDFSRYEDQGLLTVNYIQEIDSLKSTNTKDTWYSTRDTLQATFTVVDSRLFVSSIEPIAMGHWNIDTITPDTPSVKLSLFASLGGGPAFVPSASLASDLGSYGPRQSMIRTEPITNGIGWNFGAQLRALYHFNDRFGISLGANWQLTYFRSRLDLFEVDYLSQYSANGFSSEYRRVIDLDILEESYRLQQIDVPLSAGIWIVNSPQLQLMLWGGWQASWFSGRSDANLQVDYVGYHGSDPTNEELIYTTNESKARYPIDQSNRRPNFNQVYAPLYNMAIDTAFSETQSIEMTNNFDRLLENWHVGIGGSIPMGTTLCLFGQIQFFNRTFNSLSNSDYRLTERIGEYQPTLLGIEQVRSYQLSLSLGIQTSLKPFKDF